mmetsp:Transcript_21048/g.27291  ORF Transcript_21048/g.27291 Transcript_21048/m.27291 type:complete len:214 (-) Transcript_21048:240-881(-)|eukprot:CAMPEP_0197300844 /NCGR_PEP_ID=MMETSP0890-20130614/49315_1 /TAXON_ID=44058 ORGANISM="Aureoumbra lagunensis, Strain CCMP1510" /NCGR_SAMPLE_ID=MMETSP0890 /ASSEMBLY_ACC=CAM_ASM_000533 /LENGTH=213 /DNA_ID=CAMNT_0042779905 /DNA_START=63 /DNA_END=704 /DNA_ORIENTATION=-
MKIVALLPVAVVGFIQNLGVVPVRPNTLLRASYDELVRVAEEASSKFGKDSSEAKSAWEAVEEMNAGDSNAVASKPGLDVECDTFDSAACEEYNKNVEELAKIIAASKPQLETMKIQIEKIKSAPLLSATSTETNNADVEAATAAAEKATAEFGADSPEAKSAWETVEEIYDSKNPAIASVPSLDAECVTDALEKCQEFATAMSALEESLKEA